MNWPVKILFLLVPLAIQVAFWVNELRESSRSMTSPKKGIKNRARSVIAEPTKITYQLNVLVCSQLENLLAFLHIVTPKTQINQKH